MRYILILLTIQSISFTIQAQENPSKELENLYKEFQFNKILTFSDSLLNNKNALNDQEIEKIFRFRGLANYHLNNLDNARMDFWNMLLKNRQYSFDENFTSPKIIEFYKPIKEEFNSLISLKAEDQIKDPSKLDLSD